MGSLSMEVRTEVLCGYICDLEAENRKLRELVRDMWEMAYPEYPSAFAAAFADRMRELGMGVGE